MSWESKKLKDFIEFPPKISLTKGEEYEFIPMNNIDGNIKYVQETEIKEYTGGGTKFGNLDTLLARITPCLENGKLSMVKNIDKGVAFGSTEYFVFRAKKGISDPHFVYYLTRSDLVRETAIKSMSGSDGRQRASKEVVENIQVSLPPLETQKKIANILSNYDDLIENNLKRIKLLEEAAQNIYKEWFVNFRFPNHENTPIDDDTGLPVGWEKIELEHLVSLQQGFALNKKSRHHVSEEKTEFPLLKISDLINDTETLFVKETIPKQFLVNKDDIIFSRTGQVGRSFMGRKGVIYNNCFRVIPNEKIDSLFLFGTLDTPSFISYVKGLATGAAQPDLNHGAFKSVKIVLPTMELQIKYSNSFKLFLEQKEKLKSQNKTLKEARDILLPRLMNRTIEV